MYNLYFYANKRNNNCDQTIVRIIFIVLQRIAQRKSKYKLSRMKFFCYRPLNRNFIYFSLLFQASMDLPPDKAKLLKQYDNEKKWDIICDQVGTNFSSSLK